MPTIDYRLGDAGALGFAATNPDGTNMDLTGLGLRMRIAISDGYLVLPAVPETGQEIMIDGVIRTDATVVSVPFAADTIMLTPRLYQFVIEANDGSGWREMHADDHYLNVVRL